MQATYAIVDELGSLNAQIAELTRRADAIKNQIKDYATASSTADKIYEGSLFKATVVEANRDTVDYKKLLDHLGVKPTELQVKMFTKTSAVISVKLTDR